MKTGIIILFVWFGLNQLVPLYLGADLITDGRLGSRPRVKDDKSREEADESVEEAELVEEAKTEEGEEVAVDDETDVNAATEATEDEPDEET